MCDRSVCVVLLYLLVNTAADVDERISNIQAYMESMEMCVRHTIGEPAVVTDSRFDSPRLFRHPASTFAKLLDKLADPDDFDDLLADAKEMNKTCGTIPRCDTGICSRLYGNLVAKIMCAAKPIPDDHVCDRKDHGGGDGGEQPKGDDGDKSKGDDNEKPQGKDGDKPKCDDAEKSEGDDGDKPNDNDCEKPEEKEGEKPEGETKKSRALPG